jgi:hypothetical protein
VSRRNTSEVMVVGVIGIVAPLSANGYRRAAAMRSTK